MYRRMWVMDALGLTSFVGFLFIPFLVAALSQPHDCKRVCDRDARPKTCHYNFTIEWYRTLSKACYECPFNETDCFRPDCVSGNGGIKPLITVNRQVPGPAIEVCEGDLVVVWVRNDMEDGSATSIHWHGIHQKGTPYFDGVGHITQCNIGSKETFRYEFRAYPAGSHWYHGHTGMQLADGLFGPVIVRQPLDHDPNGLLYDVDDHILMTGDWIPVTSMTRYVDLMYNIYDVFLPQGLHINGRARQIDVPNKYNIVNTTRTSAKTPREVFEVEADKRYRFRFISSSGNCPVQVSVENHQLQVLANDGGPVKPRPIDVVILFPGERYDFVLTADQTPRNYWIKVIGLGDCEPLNTVAAGILRYKGSPKEEPPKPLEYTTEGKIMLNPVLREKFGVNLGLNHTRVFPDELRYAVEDVDFTNQTVDQRLYLSMDFLNNDNTKYNNLKLYPTTSLHPWKGHFTPVMDNITFNLPPIPILSQREDVDESWYCNRSTLTDSDKCLQDLCLCTHMLRFKTNEVVEIVMFNEARTFNEMGHPMHLHGHSFYVLGTGWLNKSMTTREEIIQLDSEGQLRRNYINPPLRDTVNVFDAGYAIIRFKADNPGFWFFHCHTDSHLAQGKALIIKIGDYDEFPPVPDTFPRCGGWGFSNANTRPSPSQCPTVFPTSAGVSHRASVFIFIALSCLYLN